MAKAWRWGAVALSASVVAVLISLLAGRGELGTAPPWQLTVAAPGYELIGVVMAVWAWRHPGLDRRSRRAWGLIAIAYALLIVSGILRSVFPSGVSFPTPADLLRLAFAPVLLAGLLTLPLRNRGRRARHKMWLDTAVVMIGSSMLLWYVELGQSVAAAGRIPGNVLAAAIAYPALDLVMVFGATVVLLRGAAGSVRRPAILVTAATLMLVIGDAYLGYRQSHYGDVPPDRWQFACWLTGHFLLSMAAFVQVREARGDTLKVEDPSARTAARLPYLAMGLGYLLLLLAVRGYEPRTVGLVLGAVAMTSVVVTRQIIALRENHELATTDTLTGLVNRRQLYDKLRVSVARGARGGKTVAAVLIDMNGFKQVNDTMGHEAGDQLLVAFGRILRENVFGTDVVGRLGGDEFAIVLHDIASPENALAVIHRIMTAMEEPVPIGDAAVQPQASFGVALALPGEDADALLHRADTAMYRAKQDRTTGYAVHTPDDDEVARAA